MRPSPDRPAGVVQEQGKIEDVRVLEFLEEVAIGAQFRILRLHHLVELVDADQGVLVRGVTMKEFVLDQAGELSEFRNVSSEKIDPMHHPENPANFSFARQDAAKCLAQWFARAEGAGQQPKISRKQVGQIGTEL